VSERRLRQAIATLALLGAAIAGYLTVTWAADVAPVCTTGGCGKVQSSEYAEIAGIPVAALGLGAYLAIFATALRSGPAPAAIGAALALAGVTFSAYLFVIQAFVLEAFCLWCLLSDAVMAVLVAAAVLRLRAVGREAAPA
jgi:uncharacterized membrane protein